MKRLADIAPELEIISNLGIADANHPEIFENRKYEAAEALAKYVSTGHRFTKTQLNSLDRDDLTNICRVIGLHGWWMMSKKEIVWNLFTLQDFN